MGWVGLPEIVQEGACSQHLADRHGMDPDRARVPGVDRVRNSPKPIGNSTHRLPVTEALVRDHRKERQEVEEKGDAVQEVHWLLRGKYKPRV